jgi:hypothetical protein
MSRLGMSGTTTRSGESSRPTFASPNATSLIDIFRAGVEDARGNNAALVDLDRLIPPALPHQRLILDDDHRFKVVRAGRRFGKSRLSLRAAVCGHGPNMKYRGLMSGMDVAWIAPDYPQSLIIWNEEVRPRFSGRPGISLNKAEHTVTTEWNNATLYVKSAEAIDGVRGIGANLAGVILEEAAHFDLEYAILGVIRPALMDNKGWALYQSTTKGGSYFNQICEEILAGER